jgi:hypothetical protein
MPMRNKVSAPAIRGRLITEAIASIAAAAVARLLAVVLIRIAVNPFLSFRDHFLCIGMQRLCQCRQSIVHWRYNSL